VRSSPVAAPDAVAHELDPFECVVRRAAPGRIQLRHPWPGQWHLFLYHPRPVAAEDVYLSIAGDSRDEVLREALTDPAWCLQ
jgi:hypothetical protein